MISQDNKNLLFDRTLSLEIDLCHAKLDDLFDDGRLRAWLLRAYWMWRLRRLERRIPR